MQEEQNVYESSGAGRLKTLREQAGLTQQELSRQTGVSRSLISQWENGVISVSLATKKRVAAYFGVDVSELDGEATGAQAAPRPSQTVRDSLPPRVEMSAAARQEMSELAAQYAALNHKLEQMLGRLTQDELTAVRESAARMAQAVETELVFRQVKAFQDRPDAASRAEVLRAVEALMGQGNG